MHYKLPLLALLSVSLVFTSCSKDEDPPAPSPTPTGNNNNGTASTTPNFPGSDGSLWAVNTVTVQNIPGVPPITIDLGIGVAFFTDDNYASFVPAGTVMLNGSTLAQQPNNSYVFTPSAMNPSGITFGSGVMWDVSGAGSVPAFTEDVTSFPFPEVDPITSGATVDLSAGYTVTTTSVQNADSVIFTVGGVVKTLPGNATSCNFSSTDLSSLSSGQSAVQVAAYAFAPETISGKQYYFGKEEVQSITVTLQ